MKAASTARDAPDTPIADHATASIQVCSIAPPLRWRLWSPLVLALLLLAGCGGSSGSGTPSSPASLSAAACGGGLERQHALPRWVPTINLSGAGDRTSEPFGVVCDALQWRVHWHCDNGTLNIGTVPKSRSGKPLVDNPCPGDGEAYATQTGQLRLAIHAVGAWTATVEQEVDAPVDEPPLAEMQSGQAQVLAQGSFHDVDRHGKGAVRLYRLPDGRLALRFEDFEIPINTDLYVWVEPVTGLTTSPQMLSAPHVVVAALKSTTGNQNYIVPTGTSRQQIQSVVVWCQIQQFAYVATDMQSAT
ncbi:MAG TPA: DM13 domain-containing protein [Candidatus Sulfotelmatobacter sp.]|nr:DM13 domain-containing protein [Candidatus Sulfotelmatobacter sp.]